jgi:hypothetical protein
MTINAERIKRIEVLTPRQALDTVQYMTAWLDEQRTEPQDFTAEQQIEILNALFQEAGYAPVPLSPTAKPDAQAVGQAARKLLMLLTESADDALLTELDYWLAKPPEVETKALVEVIVVPIVLTACIITLGTSFEFERKDGQTRIKGTRKGISGKDLQEVLGGFYGALKSLVGLG